VIGQDRAEADATHATVAGRPGALAGERYLLLADISGYTSFMAGVEETHGVDLSAGIPAGYAILAKLLGVVSDRLAPDFAVVKYEGDAVFASAPAAELDGRGERVLHELQALYRAFIAGRTAAIETREHICAACPRVAGLDLKMVLHRGPAVHQAVGSGSDLLGPAVTLAHRLLKNTVRTRFGSGPYLFLTGAAATGLRLVAPGSEHQETYPDIGEVRGWVIPLGPVEPLEGPSLSQPSPIRLLDGR
jgi:class 3 adenylate cyclase